MSAIIATRAAVRGALRSAIIRAPRAMPVRAFGVMPRLQAKKYAKSHEWVEYSADKSTATVGVSDYAAHQLGDVVYVELPELETDVNAGDPFGAVESVKSASDFYAPVSGTVIEANAALEEKPALINQDAEGQAWIAKIKVNGEETEGLMDEAEYKSFTESDEA